MDTQKQMHTEASDLQEVPDELVEKIAKLIVQEVPVDQIGYVLGVSTADAEKICMHEIVKNKVAEIAADRMSDLQEMNESWDSVEKRAIQVVNANLAFNKDPEFALKAARVANQATRRNRMNGNSAVPSVTGAKAVISLNVGFVQKIQSSGDVPRVAKSTDVSNRPRRDQDCLPPEQLEKVLGMEDEFAISDELHAIEAQFEPVDG